jgi:two-component system, OmpR family, phosphate regulon sensor histidine kinase PhoR
VPRQGQRGDGRHGRATRPARGSSLTASDRLEGILDDLTATVQRLRRFEADLLSGESSASERRRADAADASHMRELEQHVAERTAELAAAYEARNRLLERLHEGVVSVNRRMEVEFANAAARDILGPLREGDPLPEPWPEVSLRKFAGELFEPGPPVVERRLEVDGNPPRIYSLSGIRARRSEGPLLVFSDVTEQERLERAEREFVTNAAHQLQSPIAAITSAVEVLQLGAKHDPEERDLFLGHVEWETKRLQLLVRALLVLARAQTGQERLVGERVELGPLLTELVGAVTRSERVEVHLEDPGELAVIASPGLLEQALANVIGNAVRYTGEGRVVVSASAADEDLVVVQVRDTGPGIPKEDQERVFERFYRADRQSREGFGLGLPIARRAVEVLGGELELESNVGTGTTVRIRLRRAT